MKKTGATIFTLALALILVSSLGSGVILAKGPSDNASDRGKERASYHTEHDVVIMTCVDFGLPGAGAKFVGFDSNIVGLILPASPMGSCAVNLAFLASEHFKIQHAGETLVDASHFTSYTTARKRRVKNED